jgi:hypothetical protein
VHGGYIVSLIAHFLTAVDLTADNNHKNSPLHVFLFGGFAGRPAVDEL